jgi:hypothetical protein
MACRRTESIVDIAGVAPLGIRSGCLRRRIGGSAADRIAQTARQATRAWVLLRYGVPSRV